MKLSGDVPSHPETFPTDAPMSKDPGDVAPGLRDPVERQSLSRLILELWGVAGRADPGVRAGSLGRRLGSLGCWRRHTHSAVGVTR